MTDRDPPYSDPFLACCRPAERLAIMSTMVGHLTWCSADLLAKGRSELALMVVKEAAVIDAAIAECLTEGNGYAAPFRCF